MTWYKDYNKGSFMNALIRLASIMPDIYIKDSVDITRKFVNKNSVVVDVGCGTGTTIRKLSSYVKKCIGIEFYVKNESYANLEFINSNIENKIPLPNNISDFTICSEVLEHISNDKQLFSELVRITKLKGHILITTPNKTFLENRKLSKEKEVLQQQGHIRLGYTIQDFQKMSQKFKLNIILFRTRNKNGLLIDLSNYLWSRYEKFSVIFLTPVFRLIYYLQHFLERNKNVEGADWFILFKKM